MKSVLWLAAALGLILGLWFRLAGDEAPSVPPAEPSTPQEVEPPTMAPTLASLALPDDDAKPPRTTQPTPPAKGPPAAETKETSYTIEGTVWVNGTEDLVTRGILVAWLDALERVDGGYRMGRKTWQGDIGSDGHFSIQVTGAPAPTVIAFDYEGGLMRVESWALADSVDENRLDVKPGASNTVRVRLGAVFRLRGEVVDVEGHLLEGVQILHFVPHVMGSGLRSARHHATTPASGTFDVGPFAIKPHAKVVPMIERLAVTFRYKGLRVVQLNPWSVPDQERSYVRVVMDAGAVLAGTLVDAAGHVLPGVVVEIEYGKQPQLRRAARTDEEGRWRLEELKRGKAVLRARAFAFGCKVRREIEITDDELDVNLVAQPVPRPPPEAIKKVLGLSLVDVDDELREAYELPKEVSVLILAAEEGHDRLGIGSLEPGYGLRMVGDSAIANTREVVERLLALGPKTTKGATAYSPGVRVVYTFATEANRGNNTQHIRLTAEDMAALQRLAEKFEER